MDLPTNAIDSRVQHTPGPWGVGLRNQESPLITAGEELIDGEQLGVVAEVWPWGDGDDDGAITLANARLIAAAPELLEALKRAVDYLAGTGLYFTPDVEATLRAALAKVEGR